MWADGWTAGPLERQHIPGRPVHLEGELTRGEGFWRQGFPPVGEVWDRARSSGLFSQMDPAWESHEGRPMGGFIAGCVLPGGLGNANGTSPLPSKRRRAVLVVGGQHGREWLSMTSPLCAAEIVASRRKLDPVNACEDTDGIDLIVVPVLNPDGLHFSREIFSFWRKNRSPPHQGAGPAEGCSGVDLNRNWPLLPIDNGVGQSDNPCSNTYSGSYPLSEPESAGFVEWLDSAEAAGYDVVGFLDIHTYGQIVLGAYASTDRAAANAATYEEAGMEIVKAMSKHRGLIYDYHTGSAEGEVPLTSGTLQDWMHGRGKINPALPPHPKQGPSLEFSLPSLPLLPSPRLKTGARLREKIGCWRAPRQAD